MQRWAVIVAVVEDEEADDDGEDKVAAAEAHGDGKEEFVEARDEEAGKVGHVPGEEIVEAVGGNQTAVAVAYWPVVAAAAEQRPLLLHIHELADPSMNMANQQCRVCIEFRSY